MNWNLLGFALVALLSVATALGVVLHRNPIRSALLLVLNFVCLAILYLMLNAQVLAALQILVYAGAIMVLFLFVVQMLNLGGEQGHGDPLAGQRSIGMILGVALLGGLIYGINNGTSAPMNPAESARLTQAGQQNITQIQMIGWDMFTRYVYPFELTSILLLVGVIGTVLLSKRRGAQADSRPVSGNANS